MARESFADDALPRSTELALEPGDIALTVQIKGHAPVLLTSPDGRLSHFPRAWATVNTRCSWKRR